MKEQQRCKTPISENRKSRQPKSPQNQYYEQSLQSQKLQDVVQSQIAQQQIYLSQLKRQQHRKQNTRQYSNISIAKQNTEYVPGKFQYDINHQALLGQSINKKTQIISIKQVKLYEEKAKQTRYKFNNKFDFSIKLQQSISPKIDKSLKKSISTTKLNRQKQRHLQDKQKMINQSNQKQNSIKFTPYYSLAGNSADNKLHPQYINSQQHRNSLQMKSVKSQQKILSNQSSSKKIIPHYNSQPINAATVPFCYQNITTTINNLQSLEIQSNSSKSSKKHLNLNQQSNNKNKQPQNKQKLSIKKMKKNQYKLLKQLSSNKYYIDAALDFNQNTYQLDLQVNIEKNRGLQIYLCTPERKYEGNFLQDVMHFKYQMVRLPFNMLRLRVYLLIDKNWERFKKQSQKQGRQNNEYQQKKNQYRFHKNKQSSFLEQNSKQWKIWKQLQLPIISTEKSQQSLLNNQHNQKIKISIANIDINLVLIKINSLEFNIKLNHPQTPVSYYCINQDFNGIQLTKLSLTGKQKNKTPDDLLLDGCQGKCQII